MYWRNLPIAEMGPRWLQGFPIELVNAYARKYNIDSYLLGAVVQVESAGNTWAVRYEPSFKHTFDILQLANVVGCSFATMEMMQKTSWGLMQVMGSVAYELGLGREEYKWPSALLDPELGMEFGCRHLKNKINQFGAAPEVVYAAYNAGTPRTNNVGFFYNQGNVDKFLAFYRDLGGY